MCCGLTSVNLFLFDNFSSAVFKDVTVKCIVLPLYKYLMFKILWLC